MTENENMPDVMPEDEQYDEPIHAGARYADPDAQLRIVAADIASRIPWNPSEAVSMGAVMQRFDTVFNWLRTGNMLG